MNDATENGLQMKIQRKYKIEENDDRSEIVVIVKKAATNGTSGDGSET